VLEIITPDLFRLHGGSHGEKNPPVALLDSTYFAFAAFVAASRIRACIALLS
jgi:hypothetical protein